jgi:hypothetical protein
MTDQPPPKKIEDLLDRLSPEERLELTKLIATRSDAGFESKSSEKLEPSVLSNNPTISSLQDFQLKEAEWVWHEMGDTLRLIEQYKGLYVTAIFVSLGWLIGQVLSLSTSTVGTVGNAQPFSLDLMRHRTDLGMLLTGVAVVNLLFMVLMLEAYTHMRSLARYRFILGCKLGKGVPVWRYERWKDTPEGSTRSWTNPLNLLFFFVSTLLTVAALWFPIPAIWNSSSVFVKVIWGATGLLVISLTVSGILLGKRLRSRTAIADSPVITWDHLDK